MTDKKPKKKLYGGKKGIRDKKYQELQRQLDDAGTKEEIAEIAAKLKKYARE